MGKNLFCDWCGKPIPDDGSSSTAKVFCSEKHSVEYFSLRKPIGPHAYDMSNL